MTQDPTGDKWEQRANFWYRIWSFFAGSYMVLIGIFVLLLCGCCGWAIWDINFGDR